MKTIASLLVVLFLLTGGANAEIMVYQGTNYDVLISDPVSVGGTGTLTSFDLIVRNKTGDAAKNPSGLMAMDNALGSMGFFGDFHQNGFPAASLTSPDATSAVFADALDTHFLFTSAEVVTAVAPAEDQGVAPSGEVGAFTYSFGSFLTAGVGLLGGNDSEDWDLAQFVIEDPGAPMMGKWFDPADPWNKVNAFFQIAGADGSKENIAFSIGMIPEPATMSLLALGGVALLRRRT